MVVAQVVAVAEPQEAQVFLALLQVLVVVVVLRLEVAQEAQEEVAVAVVQPRQTHRVAQAIHLQLLHRKVIMVAMVPQPLLVTIAVAVVVALVQLVAPQLMALEAMVVMVRRHP